MKKNINRINKEGNGYWWVDNGDYQTESEAEHIEEKIEILADKVNEIIERLNDET